MDKAQKKRHEQHLDSLWINAEQAIARQQPAGPLTSEAARTSGLVAAQRRRWHSAHSRLLQAAHAGLTDLQVLDGLGESAYRIGAPQSLLPFRREYSHDLIATHFARALMMLSRWDEAEDWLKLARDSVLKTAIGQIIGVKGDIQQAIKSMVSQGDEIRKLRDLDFPMYWQALSTIADVAGRTDLRTIGEERTKALDYRNPVIQMNQAIRFLQDGELRAGWRLYDWRLWPGSQCQLPTRLADVPFWQGESLKGKSILVWTEFGFGDQLFSLRFVAELLKRHPDLQLTVKPELESLVKASFPTVVTHPQDRARDPAYWAGRRAPDYWCYAHSLAYRLRCFDYVGRKGYLHSPDSAREAASRRLKQINPQGLPTASIVWRGDVETAPMRTRAYSIEEFFAVSGVLDRPCLVVSLQKDISSQERETAARICAAHNCQFFDASSELSDFGATAGWLMQMDHVYSCDTAVAHLSGALARPTTALIRNRIIWQWKPIVESKTEPKADSNSGSNSESNAGGPSRWYASANIKYALTPKYSFMFDIRPDTRGTDAKPQ